MILIDLLRDATALPIVPFDQRADGLLLMDFTKNNTSLTEEIVNHTERFSAYVDAERNKANALYGIGGYNEHRTVYSRSEVFNASAKDEEPRRLHLGIDIWGEAGTEVHSPIDGIVHSFAFNDQFGDYGATIILQHSMGGFVFHSLYGHLSLRDIEGLKENMPVNAGELIAHFGEPKENGNWPPHLHFQLIIDMEGRKGDYPGVCKFSERERYLSNSPDPDLLLRMMQFAK